MSSRRVSFNGLAKVVMGLSDEEQAALIEEPEEFKRMAVELARRIKESTFFWPMSDHEGLAEGLVQDSVTKWRHAASDSSYTGPAIWRVLPGFTLIKHAPKAGPCDRFDDLLKWDLTNDEPTKNYRVFWIPRLVPDSKVMNPQQSLMALEAMRNRYQLPTHHLASFGSAAMLAGLILAHRRRTGEKVPLGEEWTYTDTIVQNLRSRGEKVNVRLGGFAEQGLRFTSLSQDKGTCLRDLTSLIGCFPLGVEPALN